MRRIVYTCDRCGVEIDGAAGQVSILRQIFDGDRVIGSAPAETEELETLFDNPTEKAAVEAALDPGWDLCAECIAAVLRTLIRKDAPRVIVKGPLPDTTKRRGGRPKKKTEEG